MKISIIIPIYNVEKYVLECIESVANQNFIEKFECILVDDCGSDDSVRIVNEYLQNYSGPISFIFIHHEQNKGLSAARNTAIRAAQGEYLYFLDSDDYITPDCLTELWKMVVKYPKVDIVQAFYYRSEEDLKVPPICPYPDYLNDVEKIRLEFCRFRITDAGCNRLVRKNFLVDNRIYFQDGYTQEDTIWTFDIQKHIRSIAFCKKYTYYYRLTPNSIMTSLTREKRAIDFSKVLNLTIQKLDGRKPKICEVYYFAFLAAKVKKADVNKCMVLLPVMQNYMFKALVDAYVIRISPESRNFLERAFAEIFIRLMCPIVSYLGFKTM